MCEQDVSNNIKETKHSNRYKNCVSMAYPIDKKKSGRYIPQISSMKNLPH